MQSIKLLLSTTVLSLGFLASCSSDEIIPASQGGDAPQNYTIFGVYEVKDTLKEAINKRQALATFSHEKGKPATSRWSKDDNLWVQVKEGDEVPGKKAGDWIKQSRMVLKEEQEWDRYTFYYEGKLKNKGFYDLIFNNNPLNGNPREVEVKEVQRQKMVGQNEWNVLENGVCAYGTSRKYNAAHDNRPFLDNIIVLKMQHATSYMALYPTPTPDSGLENQILEKVEIITSGDDFLAGRCTLGTDYLLTGNQGSKKITIDFDYESYRLKSTPVPIFVVLRPGRHTLTFVYHIMKPITALGGVRYLYYTTTKTLSTIDCKPGHIYDITATLRDKQPR